MYNEFEEQINKDLYYQQQGSGDLEIKTYQRLPRMRGHGSIWSLAKRYAYPAGKFLLRKALPIIKDLIDDVKPGLELAKSNVKKRVSEKIRKKFGYNFEQPGKGRRMKMKQKVRVMGGTGRKKSKKRQIGGKKRKTNNRRRKTTKRKSTKKTSRRTVKSKVFDIFK